MSPEEAVDSIVAYEGIDNGHLTHFEESGIWDVAMLSDIDENFDFRGGIGKAMRTGMVYGVSPNEGGVRAMQPARVRRGAVRS